MENMSLYIRNSLWFLFQPQKLTLLEIPNRFRFPNEIDCGLALRWEKVNEQKRIGEMLKAPNK